MESRVAVREEAVSVIHIPNLKKKDFANIFISVVGVGVLGLPYTFKQTGWLMGLLMLFAIVLIYHCMMLLGWFLFS